MPALLRGKLHMTPACDLRRACPCRNWLCSPHYGEAMPHVCAFEMDELRPHPHWAFFDVRRLDGHDQVPFFLAPVPAKANVGFLLQMTCERLPETGPIAGIFCDHMLMTDEWIPLPTVGLLTVLAPGADLLDRPPSVLYMLDLLESNTGYLSSFARFEERASASRARPQPSTTSTTTWARARDDVMGRRAILPDPVHEGPAPRDPRDHLICLVASAQCPPPLLSMQALTSLSCLPVRCVMLRSMRFCRGCPLSASRQWFTPPLPVSACCLLSYETRMSLRYMSGSICCRRFGTRYLGLSKDL